MVVGPVGPLISMICFIWLLVGCYTVGSVHGDTGQAGQEGDREQMKTGERGRHGCWASWAFDQCDLFPMFTGWKLHGVHSVRNEVSSGPGKGHKVEGGRERCAPSAENTAQGPRSRVRGAERSTQSIRSDEPSQTGAQRKWMVQTTLLQRPRRMRASANARNVVASRQ